MPATVSGDSGVPPCKSPFLEASDDFFIRGLWHTDKQQVHSPGDGHIIGIDSSVLNGRAIEHPVDGFEDSDHATLTICVKDNIELHAVCDTFSRLGTVDIDSAKLAA
jgi:hypothetical protein